MDTHLQSMERLTARINDCKRQVRILMDAANYALVVNDFAAVSTALEAAVYATKKAEAWRGERVRARKAVAESKAGEEVGVE